MTSTTSTKKSRALRVYTSPDTGFEAPLERYFLDGPVHRAEDNAIYDIDQLAEVNQEFLLRSKQEFANAHSLTDPKILEHRLCWINLLFRWEEPEGAVFLHSVMKSNTYQNGPIDYLYKVTCYAKTPAQAKRKLLELRKAYGPKVRDRDGRPGIYLLGSDILKRGPELLPISDEFQVGETLIPLHYGKAAPEWIVRLEDALKKPGLSVLTGPPGTGKTSILRHLIRKHQGAMRFYFLPVEEYQLLTSSLLLSFWEAERKSFPAETKILVLEDAENLINERGMDNHSAVSWLLNFTDGLTTRPGQPHIVCTLNSKMETMDGALKRPGRLRFIHHFNLLSYETASLLSAELGKSPLAEKREYSLAEIYHPEPLIEAEPQRSLGFAR